MKFFLTVLFLCAFSAGFAQSIINIRGKISSQKGEALQHVNIRLAGSKIVSESDQDGLYSIQVPYKQTVKISFSLTGYISKTIELNADKSEINLDILLINATNELTEVEVKANSNRPGNITRIDGGLIQNIPSASGIFESVLKTLPGVSANNELSSQYSVRGGNFDENLIYINDVQIFRPLLVRNGQQEGLSFVNPELVSQASFSAGGFEAKYGEKLSSVLDIRYNKPDSQQVTLSAGLLGLSATAKLLTTNTYTLIGARSKTNQSILKSQAVKGSYQPQFYDIQILHFHQLNKKLNVSLLGDYNLSRFTLIPNSRETTFGTLNEQLRLSVNYQGQEKDNYESLTGALTFVYKPQTNTTVKWINSAFQINEQENFDIEGQYIFDGLETEESTSSFGKVRSGRGFGIDYDYARNQLIANVYSSELRGSIQKNHSFWDAGLRYQYDQLKDNLNEYSFIDSAGYTLPYTPGPLMLTNVTYAQNNVLSNRFTAFVQNTFSINEKVSVLAGVRSNYSSLNSQLLVSPRISVLYRPDNANLNWRFSAGSYNQPPFYRELRDFNGNLVKDTKAQKSLHFLAAADYRFIALGTNLKFSSEVYFKKMTNLIPYKIENLRIRYFAGQQAKGYAAGADFSLSGEFIEGLESAFRLSVMKTEEDIKGDFYFKKENDGSLTRIEPGYLKRPTDQRINFSAFFQDKLFNSPTYKVHLILLYGSALPVGPPQTDRYQDIFKIPAYRRADIGFSKNFSEGKSGKKLHFVKKYFDSLVAYAEVFNLLNINNTVSYFWIKDVSNNQFAVPNYLTSRQLNFKIIANIKNR